MATIGKTFTFSVYARRWGRKDHYRLTLTETGWDFEFMNQPGQGPIKCEPDGNPGMRANFDQDSIHYSESLFFGIEYLHDHLMTISDDDMQNAFDQLADWVSTTEASVPNEGALTGVL